MSKANKQEIEYIINRVEKEYPSDRAFYQGKVSQKTWDALKRGESEARNLRRWTWEAMVSTMFTDYEYMLFNRAKSALIYNTADDLGEEYDRLRIEHATHIMNNGGRASVDSAIMVVTGDEPNRGTRFKVEDDLGNTLIFYINIPSHQVPSGRRNRLEWFNTYFDRDILN